MIFSLAGDLPADWWNQHAQIGLERAMALKVLQWLPAQLGSARQAPAGQMNHASICMSGGQIANAIPQILVVYRKAA